MELGGHEAQIAKGTDLQREAEAVVVAPLSSDQDPVAFGEREIPDQVLGRDLGGEPPEPFPLGVSQEAAGHPSLALGEVAVERGPADPERPADVVDGVRLVVVQREGLGLLLRVQLPRPAALLSAGPGRVEPGPGPLADDVPLELGQGGEDVEDQLAAAGRRVDALLEAPEADLPFLELPDGLDEVPDAAAQAVELPDDEGVPLPEVCEGLIEPRPLGTCTAGLVREDLLATGAVQGVGLEIEASARAVETRA